MASSFSSDQGLLSQEEEKEARRDICQVPYAQKICWLSFFLYSCVYIMQRSRSIYYDATPSQPRSIWSHRLAPETDDQKYRRRLKKYTNAYRARKMSTSAFVAKIDSLQRKFPRQARMNALHNKSERLQSQMRTPLERTGRCVGAACKYAGVAAGVAAGIPLLPVILPAAAAAHGVREMMRQDSWDRGMRNRKYQQA